MASLYLMQQRLTPLLHAVRALCSSHSEDVRPVRGQQLCDVVIVRRYCFWHKTRTAVDWLQVPASRIV